VKPYEPRGNLVAEYNYNGTKVKVFDDFFVSSEEVKAIKSRISDMYVNSMWRKQMKEEAAV
jgi:hypothetical protein